jgi:hypothetical protein
VQPTPSLIHEKEAHLDPDAQEGLFVPLTEAGLELQKKIKAPLGRGDDLTFGDSQEGANQIQR